MKTDTRIKVKNKKRQLSSIPTPAKDFFLVVLLFSDEGCSKEPKRQPLLLISLVLGYYLTNYGYPAGNPSSQTKRDKLKKILKVVKNLKSRITRVLQAVPVAIL